MHTMNVYWSGAVMPDLINTHDILTSFLQAIILHNGSNENQHKIIPVMCKLCYSVVKHKFIWKIQILGPVPTFKNTIK